MAPGITYSAEALRRVRGSVLLAWLTGSERATARLHNGDRQSDEPPGARASLFWNSAAEHGVGPLLLNVWMVTALRNVHRSTMKSRLINRPAKGASHEEVRLGIDVACRADHRASLADDRGEFIWSSWRFRTTTVDLERLWAKIPDGPGDGDPRADPERLGAPVCVAPSTGATVILVPPEQSADLRDYYNKYTKTDRLDSRVLARLPLLHPEGLRGIDDLGPAESLRRAIRHRASLVKRRSAASLRLDALVELLGPGWADSSDRRPVEDVPGRIGEIRRSRALKRLGRARLAALLIRSSGDSGARTRPMSSWRWRRDSRAVVGRGDRLHRVGPGHRPRGPSAPLSRRRDPPSTSGSRCSMTRPTQRNRPLDPGARARPLCSHLRQRRRLQPLRQPGRRPLLYRLRAQDRRVRSGGRTQGHTRPATPACARPSTWQRTRSPHRPHPGRRYHRLS